MLAELVARTGETSGLSVIEGDEVVYYLDHVETTNEVTLRDWTGAPGSRCTSCRRDSCSLAAQPPPAIAAYLARPLARLTARTMTQPARIRRRLASIRRDGYVWTIGEFDDGITSVAAPVVDAHGATVAAIHCHGPSYRFPGADVDTITDVIDRAHARRDAAQPRPFPIRWARR